MSVNIQNSKLKEQRSQVVIAFAGDSGDGMQVSGGQFAINAALMGNDVQTFPDFPAEIRAPAGTIAGVSGFTLCFADHAISTPGDAYDVLIAMNPAALKKHLQYLKIGGLIILDDAKWTDKDLKKAGFASDPCTSGELQNYQCVLCPMTDLTLQAVESLSISRTLARKCKNMFALGLVYWLYDRHQEATVTWIKKKFKDDQVSQANQLAFMTGYNYALTVELMPGQTVVKSAPFESGRYRHITGNQAMVLACVTQAVQSKAPFLMAGYPITPASDILHQLTHYASLGIRCFQAEDEMSAIGAAVGAAFGGASAVCATSGPGLDLKQEFLGLAVMAEVPLVVIDVQRAGPSTGMPTKTEQADLLTAMYGRHGECPLAILAPASPKESYTMVLEAFKIAQQFMIPVIVLSDASIANSSEPWKLPSIQDLPSCHLPLSASLTPRSQETLARPWVIPGTLGGEHRLGGLEKDAVTGNISYCPQNHEAMVSLREEKIKRIQSVLPPLECMGAPAGDVLVISWGSTYGAIHTAVQEVNGDNARVGHLHLRYLNPWQSELGAIMKRFKKIIVPELNRGQLCQLLRATYLVDAIPVSKVQGMPWTVQEMVQILQTHLKECAHV